MLDPRRDRVLGLLADGLSLRETARVSGVYKDRVGQIAREAGLVLIAEGNKGGLEAESLARARADAALQVDTDGDYTDARGRLTLAGRGVIQHLVGQGATNGEVAAAVGVNRTTAWRELGRCGGDRSCYRARIAQAQVEAGTARPKACRLDDPELRAQVLTRLEQRWSPEQIAADLRRCFPGREDIWVSHETIYRALYVQGAGSLRSELKVAKATRTGRTARKPRSSLPPPASNRAWIGPEDHISARPAEVEDRAVPGHWEGDLVLGARCASAVLTLVERSTRYLMTYRLPDLHDAPTVTGVLVRLTQGLPSDLHRTLTWDQGSELASHLQFTVATDCKVYFCDPHSPWQRGTNENTNGLLRDFFPKGTDFARVTDAELAQATRMLNTRPRKTLAFDTPADRLQALLTVAQAS